MQELQILISGYEETVYHKLDPAMSTEFVGYNNLIAEGNVLALVVNDEIVNEAKAGDNVSLIADKTPFYAEMGGQCGDSGVITANSLKIELELLSLVVTTLFTLVR